MSHVIVSEPFALVRDHLRGTEEWHPASSVNRLGNCARLQTVLVCFDYWFACDDNAYWYGPFCFREQASNFLSVAQAIVRAA